MTAGSIPAPMVIPMRAPQTGKSKMAIDTNTKIALTCNDLNVIMYYTINGTKPEPFQPRTTPGFCTIRYRHPIRLPSGKVTLKALAVAKDGVRESNVVSKKFDVEYVPVPEEEELEDVDNSLAFQEEVAEEKLKLQMKRSAKNLQLSSAKSAWKESSTQKNISQLMTDMSFSDEKKPQTSARYLEERFKMQENPTIKRLVSTRYHLLETIADQLSASEWKGVPEARKPPENSTQSLRLQRQTDFLKCVYCFADRPADPYAKFCNVCGKPVPPLPQNRLPPPEPGQMGLCLYCNSLVPLNTESCVVCEGPIPVQNQPQASIKLSDRLVCSLCGTANPSNISTCVLCDSKLTKETNLQKFNTSQQQTLLSATGTTNSNAKFMKCSKCMRINNIDARFCDWCGTQPNQSSCIQCPKCRANNHLMSTYCGACGTVITAPFRNMDSKDSSENLGISSGDNQWLPVSRNLNSMSRSSMNSVATQTVGLFYPSQREIQKRKEEEAEKAAFEKQMRDRQPLLTAISPGRGYWRKQIEHICQHLKVHAQNCAEFRALIAEPKMGKLVSGTVHEDAYELSLTLNFALSMPNGNMSANLAREEYVSPYMEGNILESFRSESSQVSETTEDSSTEKMRKPKKTRRMKTTKKSTENRLAPIDRKLMKEVGAKGEGDVSQVQQLIDEGADPNCTNKDGVPVLLVAVKNNHTHCIPVLVQAGAIINQKGPPSCHGNTALHEAVNLGSKGGDILDVLLGCGADMKKRNNQGDTPYDLAIKSGHEILSRRLVASLGQAQLEKLLRTKQTPLE